VNGRESGESNGIRWMAQRAGLASKLPEALSSERRIGVGAASFRTPRESEDCSSAFTSTAEKSASAQSLPGAISISPLRSPVLAISWHCSGRAPEEQCFAAQSGAHTGAIKIANRVNTAKRTLRGPCRRIEFFWFMLIHSRYPGVASSSTTRCYLVSRHALFSRILRGGVLANDRAPETKWKAKMFQ
jgi:hypothetical protein